MKRLLQMVVYGHPTLCKHFVTTHNIDPFDFQVHKELLVTKELETSLHSSLQEEVEYLHDDD